LAFSFEPVRLRSGRLPGVPDHCPIAHLCAVVYQWREQDSKFAAAWEAAQLIGTEALADGLEDTASIRAKGIRVKVFDEKTGEVIGERISDRMLEFMLKAKRPQIYARTDSNNQTVTVVMPTLQDMQAKYKALGLEPPAIEGDFVEVKKIEDKK
jgi:hypothetical protein